MTNTPSIERQVRATLERWCDSRDDPNDMPARMVRSWHMDLARDVAAALTPSAERQRCRLCGQNWARKDSQFPNPPPYGCAAPGIDRHDWTASPPLPHPDIEGRARELLIDIFVAEGAAGSARQVRIDPEAHRPAINLIVKALSLPTTEIRRKALEEAAAWHDQRYRDTPDAFEMEFHDVSRKAIRSLASKEEGRL